MTIQIYMNDKPFVFLESECFRTGAQIKGRCGIDIQYSVMHEMSGMMPDKFIGDSETIKLTKGDRFIAVPPCSF